MDHKVILACIIVELLVIAVGLIIKAKNDKELKEMYQKAYNESVNEINHLHDMIAEAQSKLAKEIEEHNEHIKYYEALLHMQKEVCDERLREAGYEMDDEDERKD
jgi:vacuolar-type H+-ATPase subunit I/STV1